MATRRGARYAPSARSLSTVTIHIPPEGAPRESPTPVVFVSASAWDKASNIDIDYISTEIAKTGFTCLACDLPMPEEPTGDSKALMRHFEHQLVDSLARSGEVMFPPVIVARSAAALVAQTFISSHRASGMFLISPPTSNAAVKLLPSPLEEFNYEMKFPIGIIGTAREIDTMRRHRFQDDQGYVDTYGLEEHGRLDVLESLNSWLDERGF
ncbi:hypothetical protein HGRIS_007730 [Hohenbuehelia grisea]|uniref:Uncharacterized protein n=1 Tax=Hohenbuehelia grisea TaxID=104357 RepID=A0ABR3J659_9AGAR